MLPDCSVSSHFSFLRHFLGKQKNKPPTHIYSFKPPISARILLQQLLQSPSGLLVRQPGRPSSTAGRAAPGTTGSSCGSAGRRKVEESIGHTANPYSRIPSRFSSSRPCRRSKRGRAYRISACKKNKPLSTSRLPASRTAVAPACLHGREPPAAPTPPRPPQERVGCPHRSGAALTGGRRSRAAEACAEPPGRTAVPPRDAGFFSGLQSAAPPQLRSRRRPRPKRGTRPSNAPRIPSSQTAVLTPRDGR